MDCDPPRHRMSFNSRNIDIRLMTWLALSISLYRRGAGGGGGGGGGGNDAGGKERGGGPAVVQGRKLQTENKT